MVISVDFEMAWAWRYSKTLADAVATGLRERENVPILLDVFDNYGIRATWATVGHLFLERCTKKNGYAHPELRRIPHFKDHWHFKTGDWYDHDPCTTLQNAPAWYGADLIDRILEAKVNHEVGSHTFSHLNCRDRICPPAVMEDEIALCCRLAGEKGLRLKSMVFPGGTNGNYAVLKKYGFTNYRYNDPDWDMFYPERDTCGLWRLPSSESIGTDSFNWSLSYRLDRMQRNIDKAIQERTVFHMWFHPSLDRALAEKLLPEILAYAKQRIENGDLWCTTMGDLAQFCEQPFAEQSS
jgi:peptidoglycan/xylan/chitin deacetylase (PgdA/CDA1 family)